MKYFLAVTVAAAIVIIAGGASAQKTQAQLQAEITSTFPDNTTGIITPAATRTFLNDLVNTLNVSAGNSASINVDTYGNGSVIGRTGWQVTNSDNTALSTERYSAWIGNTSQGTGNGAASASTFALGLSNIKANWTGTTVAGQAIGLNVVARGGDNNVLTSGDVSGITVNTGSSFSNNLAQQYEGVSGYFPGGSTTGSLFLNTQVGSVRATGLDTGSNTGIGFFTQAQNGLLGYAFQASNLCASPVFGTCSKWLGAFNYVYDDGTHTAYQAFSVNQLGQVTLAGFGAAGTNQKTLRVGSSATNVLGITNAAASVEILSLTDAGALSTVAGITSGVNGGTGGSLTLNGATSGSRTIATTATGSEFTFAGAALDVGSGGTGQTTLANHGVLVGAGASGITQLAAAASGTILNGQGAGADPAFTATPTIGQNGGTGGTLALAGATSGNFGESVSATGGHIFITSNISSTLTAGCNGAGSSISGTDVLGTVVGQTAVATSCTVTFGTAYAVAPRCIPTGRTTPVTSYSTSTTTLVINFASTASATFDWICYGG